MVQEETMQSFKEKKLSEYKKVAACQEHENFDGPLTCDTCVIGKYSESFLSESIKEATRIERERIKKLVCEFCKAIE